MGAGRVSGAGADFDYAASAAGGAGRSPAGERRSLPPPPRLGRPGTALMAGITLAQAEAQLTSWITASTAVAGNQSYSIGDRTLTRANAREIRENIEFWDRKVKRLSRGGILSRGVIPVP